MAIFLPILIAAIPVVIAACKPGSSEEDSGASDVIKPDTGSDAGQDLPPKLDAHDNGTDEFVDERDFGQELDALICGECDVPPDDTPGAEDACNCSDVPELPDSDEDSGCSCGADALDIVLPEPTPDEGTDLSAEPIPEPVPETFPDISNDIPEVSEDVFFDIPKPIDNGPQDEGVNNCLEAGMACYLGDGACRAYGEWVCRPDRSGVDCNAAPGTPTAEECNGTDDDCNERIDDDILAPESDKQLGVCVESRKICDGINGWKEPDYYKLPSYELFESRCDGKDNDCDGNIDEGLAAPFAEKQYGVCRDSLKICVGINGWVEPDYTIIPTYEDVIEITCDGLDNNCNGFADEGCQCNPNDYDPKDITCGTGECTATGITECVNGTVQNVCTPGSPGTEVCDGNDNDCDGTADNDLATLLADKRFGVCAGSVKICSGINGWAEPNYFLITGYESIETKCDGLDNDCDGLTDVGLTPPLADNQNGVCEHSLKLCMGVGGWQNPVYETLAEYEMLDSSCNGIDNDCDGLNDEDFVPTTTSCGTGECRVSVTSTCVGGVQNQPNCVPRDEIEESCDGKDNDCDGVIDNGLGTTTCGVGDCQRTVNNCSNGVTQNCEPGVSSPEICGNTDNDCDGHIDEIETPQTKRLIFNCYSDPARTNKTDCWTPPAVGDSVYVSLTAEDASTTCNKNNGINLCYSGSSKDYPLDLSCFTTMKYIGKEAPLYYQDLYEMPGGLYSLRLSIQPSMKVAGFSTNKNYADGIYYLFNIISCPLSCN